MSKFEEKKKEIKEAAQASKRKTFNETEFNELATALINEPDHVVKVITTVNGEVVEKETTPIEDLRKSLIGQVAKAAGCDTAEQGRLVKEMQFSKLPMYGYVSEAVEQYIDTGKAFRMAQKPDMRTTSLIMETQPEEVKEVKSPATGEISKCRYSAYRKVKVKSSCPANLREKL